MNNYSRNISIDKSMEKAELLQLASNLQSRLNKSEESNVDLRAQLLNCTEERDLIRKKFEEQSISEEKFTQIHEQMLHKDNKIMELNNVILEKERQIIDLQEMCTEQGKVAKSKSLAFGIVNKRLRELDSRNMKDVATETDFIMDEKLVLKRSRSPRRNSPGRAIPQFKFATNGNGSPPPIDPEDGSSFTTETLNLDAHEVSRTKKHRKKVTFDDETSTSNLREFESANVPSKNTNYCSNDMEELLMENENLRQIISEMEKRNAAIQKPIQPESLQILKVKAAAQTRIKELEGIAAQSKQNYDSMTVEMRAIIEQLKESREWVLNENYKLQEQLDTSKQKCTDLHNELDTSLKTIDIFRKKLDANSRRFDELQTELYQSRVQTQKVSDEKAILAIEVERHKEAIIAQDEFISLLEGDLIVYEAHVGILRDSLGKKVKMNAPEDRQHLKSKAFTAKINALESEKEEIAKKNNEEKLRVKALAVKIRYMEEERDTLGQRNSELAKELSKSKALLASMETTNEETGAMEQRNAELVEELSKNKELLASMEMAKNLQEREMIDLRAHLESLEEKITQKQVENEELEQNLHSSNIKCEFLSATLSERDALEQRNEELAKELSKSKALLESMETANNSKEREMIDLRAHLESLEEEITQKHVENEELEQKLHSSNIECESLSATLTEQKTRLDKLIRILTEIVDRFKMGSNFLDSDSDNSIDEFINKIGSNAEISTGQESSNVELMNKMETKQQLQRRPSTFSKGVQALLLDANEIGELRHALQQREERIKMIEYERENEQKNSLGIREQFEANVNLLNAENEELKNCKQKYEIELEEAKHLHGKINLELNELREKIGLMEMERQRELEWAKNCLVENQTQTKEALKNEQFVQTNAWKEKEEEKNKKQRELECTKNCLVEAEIQTDLNETIDQFVQTTIIGDFMDKETKEEEENKKELEVCLIRKESQKLLVDCVKEHAEFERQLDGNVQQLLELKTELENSVDVLKGEIWSLNSELKKHFTERDFLKSQLSELEQQIQVYKSQNEHLEKGMREKDEKLAEIGGQNDRLEKKIQELNSLLEEKSQKAIKLEGLMLKMKEKFAVGIQKRRLDLDELRQINSDYKLRFGQSIDQLEEFFNAQKQFEASRLTIKTADNDKLVRENAELIETNAQLQSKLAQMDECKIEEIEEIAVEANFTRESVEMETSTIVPLMGKLALEADIDIESVDFQDKQIEEWNEKREEESKLDETMDDVENEREKKLKPEKNQIGIEEEEKITMEFEDEKTPITDEEEKTTEVDDDWNWNQDDEEEEEKEQTEEPQFGTKLMETSQSDANADDWNWGDEQQEEENEQNEDEGRAGNEANQRQDEWAWNDDEEEEEKQVKKDAQKKVVDQNVKQQKKDVKNLFDDW